MNYPTLPMAIVNLLAEQNAKRVESSNKRMVMICRHHGESVNFSTYELAKDPQNGAFHWDPIIAGLGQIQAAGPSDSLMIVFPRDLEGPETDQKADVAVLVRPNAPLQVFQWQWEPHFNLYHIGEEYDLWKTVTQGAGVEIMQQMINKEHGGLITITG